MLTKDKLNSLLSDELVACQSTPSYLEVLLNAEFDFKIRVRGPKTKTGYLIIDVNNDCNYIFERLINKLCEVFKVDYKYQRLSYDQYKKIEDKVFEIYKNDGFEFRRYKFFDQVVRYIFLLNLSGGQAAMFEQYIQRNDSEHQRKNYVRTFIAEPIEDYPNPEVTVISSKIIKYFTTQIIQVVAENSVFFAEQLSQVNPQNAILNTVQFIHSLKSKSTETQHKYAQLITDFNQLMIAAITRGAPEFIDYIFEYNIPHGVDYIFEQVYSNQQIMDHIQRYYIHFQLRDVHAEVKKKLIELCTYLQLNQGRIDCELSPDRLTMVKYYYQNDTDFIMLPATMSSSEMLKRLTGNYNSQEGIVEHIMNEIRTTVEFCIIHAKFDIDQWYAEPEYENVYQLLDGLLNQKPITCVYAQGDLHKIILSEQSDTVFLSLDPYKDDNSNGVILKRELLMIVLDQSFRAHKKELCKLLAPNQYVDIEARIQKQLRNINPNNIDNSSYIFKQIISIRWNNLELDRLPIKKQNLSNNNIPLIEY